MESSLIEVYISNCFYSINMSNHKLNPSSRDDYIRLLSGEGYSQRQIIKALNKYGIKVIQSTISSVLNKKYKRVN